MRTIRSGKWAVALLCLGCPDSSGGDGQDGTASDSGGTMSGGATAPTGGADSGSTSADTTDTDQPPDGVCDLALCDSWDINDPPDGIAQRTCTDPDCEEAVALPDLDENYFRCHVWPVFQEGCGNLGCHSPETPDRRLRLYARWHSREYPIHSGSQDVESPHDCALGFPESAYCGRHPLTGLEWATNFDSSRLFMIDVTDATGSQLLIQPLADDPVDLEHDGFDIWASTSDVRYQTVLAWLEGATDPADCGGLTQPDEGNALVFDYYQFACPECGPFGSCTPSGATPPCDPNVCL